MPKIKKSTLTFLKKLAKNNDRDWFAENKPKYQAALDNMIDFSTALLEKLSQHDQLEEQTGKKVLHRIYRDVRFSKDKRPYKRNFSGSFTRDGKLRRGGYYFHVVPQGLHQETFIQASCAGGGFYNPEREDLKRIREELAVDESEFRAIVTDKDFVRVFGEMQGDKLKTSPRGYPKDHPHIELLRYKNFYAMRRFTDAEVLSDDYVDLNLEALLTIRPFFDYFTDVLTTDGNGELVV
ncbi:DUF2461 domain-containing protein [Neolewinella antarctica]|uniref:Uncharacterized protein (TIGR02453 family) n=1 Tax=Neolewinella antarctica TaxID=442734 RepID=A0ABX0XG16_9BACT|nr:DUF2461 domain-containing protein [Neolewinella antarctica]NJC27844.1 uncharacterized protein (TIGR02453 family) [Neolewinella antarctica]